ncbi:response regulator [Pseudomonas sp. TCU-HL1]|uniref:response regulator n=1 Tax=Pseudomonas sp. TCU-HL1 TaxID=1856685 RepID=UPI00083E578F|nr:response regulator [Pseudomonas sp. TCU-HL1]AOE86378.1 transcriptional regulator [Pseudomonas sp. TCU-HL1]
MIKIQLVDDDPHILSALQRLLRPQGWALHLFDTPEAALAALAEHRYAAIVCDLNMPQLNGLTYLQFARQRQPDALRMLLSAHGDRATLMQAINRAEVYRFLSKPWENFEIESALQAAVDLFQLRDENRRLLEQVRGQQDTLDRQRRELLRLETKHPGLTRVRRDTDGAVLLEGYDVDD